MTTCQHNGCNTRLAHNNRRGLCKAHANQCTADGCEEWISRNNKTGLCADHSAMARRELKPHRYCDQCGDTLHHNNKRGKCGRCRSLNRQKTVARCQCGKMLDYRNKTGKCFDCIYPNVTHNPRRKHTFKPSPDYTVRELTKTAAWLTMTPVEVLMGSLKQKYITRIRFAIWHLAEPHYSYPHIGRMFGDRDHSTIIHGCQRAADLLETDKNFATLVASIKRETLARREMERKAA